MNDLISRQDAIRKYQEVCNGIKCGECPLLIKVNTEKGSHLITDCILEAFLHNLPSASVGTEMSLPKWIPCSERLPEESVPVLVCFTDWKTQEKTIDVSCLRDRNLWDDHGRYNKECVAWMPLPEPYKGGDTE